MLYTDCNETFEIDFDNPHCHGDFLVGITLNEKVNKKKMLVSSIVVIRPNTHPGEVPHLKAVASAGEIKIESLAHKAGYLKNSSDWLKKLHDNKDALEAEGLHTTLTTMVTSLTKANAKAEQIKTTTLKLSKSSGFELAPDYFSLSGGQDATTWPLRKLPLPYEYKIKIANKEGVFLESCVVWRAFIKGTAQEIEEEKKTISDDGMDLLEMMMQGTKI